MDHNLKAWNDQVLKLLPRNFKTLRFKAVASYEGCGTTEKRSQALETNADLLSMIEILKEWFQKLSKRSHNHVIQAAIEPLISSIADMLGSFI